MCTESNLIDHKDNTDHISTEQTGFIFTPGQVLDAIIQSNQNRTAIGIRAPGIFNGVLVTGIENIILDDDSDPIIVLKKYDSNGKFLDRDRLRLSEIESVCPFKSSFENPFLRELGSVSRFYFRTP
jgi:hypothetical protein